MCEKLAIPVHEVCYFRFGDPAGYVVHDACPTLRAQWWVSMGPLLFNSAVAVGVGALAGALWVDINPLVDLFLMWLAISIGAHAIPSHTDIDGVSHMAATKPPRRAWVRGGLTLFLGTLRLVNYLRFFWVDILYGWGLYWLGLIVGVVVFVIPAAAVIPVLIWLALWRFWLKAVKRTRHELERRRGFDAAIGALWATIFTGEAEPNEHGFEYTRQPEVRALAFALVTPLIEDLPYDLAHQQDLYVEMAVEMAGMGLYLHTATRKWEEYLTPPLLYNPREFYSRVGALVEGAREVGRLQPQHEEAVQGLRNVLRMQLCDSLSLREDLVPWVLKAYDGCVRTGFFLGGVEDQVARDAWQEYLDGRSNPGAIGSLPSPE